MKRSSLAIVVSLTAILTAPLAAQAGGNPVKNGGHKPNYSQPNKSSVPQYTNYNPSSANAGAAALAGSSSNSGANASNGGQSVDLNNNLHNANDNTANGGAGGSSNVDLNNQNNNHNSNTNNVQGGAGGSSYNSNEANGGNGYGGIGVGIGKGGEGGKGGQGGTGGTASADNTNNNHVNSQGGTGYGGTGGSATNNNSVHSGGGSGYGGTGGTSTSTSQGGKGGSVGNTTSTSGSSSSGSGNYTNTSIGGNHYNEATQAPQLGAPHAVPGNAGFAYNSYVCNNLQTSVAVSAGNKTSSTSGGVNFIGFGIGGGNSNSDISFPKEYAAGMRTIPLQIAAGTLGSMSTLNVSDTTPSWFASMILRMSADPSDHKQVAQYNAIADQMQTIKTSQIHCPNMQPSVNVSVDNSLKAVREYNNKRHQERQEMRDHEHQERQNAPKPPRRYRTENVPNGNRY
jgi:hypothetical protein